MSNTGKDPYMVPVVYTPIKRVLDIFGAIVCMIVSLPLYLLICILIKSEDGGKVIFRQERVGYRGGAVHDIQVPLDGA